MVKLKSNGDTTTPTQGSGMMAALGWKRALMVGLIVAVLAVIGVFVARGISRHVAVDVRNDGARAVRIASCVDDAADVNPGEVFTAEGSPSNDRLACLVTYGSAPSQCRAIPRVKAVKGTVALSQLVRVSDSECH
jgi:hypothetical protein